MNSEQPPRLRHDIDIHGRSVDTFGMPYAEIFDYAELGRLTHQIYRIHHPAHDILETDDSAVLGTPINAILDDAQLSEAIQALGTSGPGSVQPHEGDA